MKATIYMVTMTSYTASDNNIYSDVKTFADEQQAIDCYDRTCDQQRGECQWGEYADNEDHADDYQYPYTDNHLTEEREAGDYVLAYEASSEAYEGYCVQVKLEKRTVEIAAPAVWLFDREHFTEEQAARVTHEEALQMSDGTPKSERKIWRYEGFSGTFASDFNRGCITPDKYFIRIM